MRSGNLYIEAATRESKQATSRMAIINPAYSRKTKGPHCRWCGAVPAEVMP